MQPPKSFRLPMLAISEMTSEIPAESSANFSLVLRIDRK
jgi:hypothetical protein